MTNRGINMKKTIIPTLSTLLLLWVCSLSVLATESLQGLYLGVSGYGTVSYKPSFSHEFFINGVVKSYPILSDQDYSLENKLATGYFYDLTMENGEVVALAERPSYTEGWVSRIDGKEIVVNDLVISLAEGCEMGVIHQEAGSVRVTAKEILPGSSVKVYGNPATHIYETFVAESYTPPVVGTAGERSLKNFLATAMMPVGHTLYVYGGNWNWQDTGASNPSTTIGLSPKTTEFFQSKDQYYSYINRSNYSKSYFPHQQWNQYYFAGMDCSGYVAWSIYNTLQQQSGQAGYVYKSTQMAYQLANLGLGSFSSSARGLKVGDVFSMEGHIWIYLGACDDGSFVIMHSTPSPSSSGAEGGGVQLTGVGTSASCQAVALSQHYMETYFPQWGQRYDAIFKSYGSYTASTTSTTGRFSWHNSSAGLLDIDGYGQMSAPEILEDLFGQGDFSGEATRGQAVSYLWHSLNRPSPTVDSPFHDVGGDIAQAVAWAFEEGVTSGTGEGVFSPDTLVSRAQFLCYLWNLSSRPVVDGENPFVDVAEDAYYTPALLWAVANGYTSGTTATTFSPDETVTREQIVLFLRKFLGE